ncbi:MAG TPA: hypothetical protein VGF26_09795 [Ramlibacter sp.]
MKKTASMLAMAAILAGCAQPQTRDAFVQTIRGGQTLTYTESYVAKRSLDDVTRSVEAKAGECFSWELGGVRAQGSTMRVAEEYIASVQKVDRNRSELTVRRLMSSSAIKQPAGGFYFLAVDMERVGTNSTKLTYYGNSLSSGKANWAAVKQWSDGQMVACP